MNQLSITEPRLLFIGNIPAAGKSFLGKWLESQKGFIHIDPEENDRLDSLGVHAIWNRCVASLDCGPFATSLRQLDRPVVFNWGFPVRCLPIAAALKTAGFQCWWLDADIKQARAEFKRLGKPIPSPKSSVAHFFNIHAC